MEYRSYSKLRVGLRKLSSNAMLINDTSHPPQIITCPMLIFPQFSYFLNHYIQIITIFSFFIYKNVRRRLTREGFIVNIWKSRVNLVSSVFVFETVEGRDVHIARESN